MKIEINKDTNQIDFIYEDYKEQLFLESDCFNIVMYQRQHTCNIDVTETNEKYLALTVTRSYNNWLKRTKKLFEELERISMTKYLTIDEYELNRKKIENKIKGTKFYNV